MNYLRLSAFIRGSFSSGPGTTNIVCLPPHSSCWQDGRQPASLYNRVVETGQEARSFGTR